MEDGKLNITPEFIKNEIIKSLYRNKLSILCVVIFTLICIGIGAGEAIDLRWSGWFVLATMCGLVILLVRDEAATDVSMMWSTMILLMVGIVDISKSFRGFANEGVLTIVVMLVVCRGIENSGAMEYLEWLNLGGSWARNNMYWAQFQMMTITGLLSAVTNNTPQVAIMIPVIEKWCKANNWPVSQFMMPLSFSSTSGGTLSMIGTSTNLIVKALAIEDFPGIKFPLFEIGAAGIVVMFGINLATQAAMPLISRRRNDTPVVRKKSGQLTGFNVLAGLWGNITSSLTGQKSSQVAPAPAAGAEYKLENQDPTQTQRPESDHTDGVVDNFLANEKAYVVFVRVADNSPAVGKTVGKAGLKHIPGLFLAEILRAAPSEEVIAAPPPEITLYAGDTLSFSGNVENVRDVWKIPGMIPVDAEDETALASRHKKRTLVEVVVGSRSQFLGKTVKETGFRARYNAAIIGYYRNGERLAGNLGEQVLHVGDTLLLETNDLFISTYKHSLDFALVAEVSGANEVDRGAVQIKSWDHYVKVLFAIGCFVVMLTLEGLDTKVDLDNNNLVMTGLVTIYLFLFTGLISVQDIRESVQIPIFVTVAGTFALAAAMDKTGVADLFARQLVNAFDGGGKFGVLFALYVLSVVITNIMSNGATASLIYPIAIKTAAITDINIKAMLYCLMIGSSSGYCISVGYQTHIMVQGPGGYTFMDFFKVGGIVQLACAVPTVAMCLWAYDT